MRSDEALRDRLDKLEAKSQSDNLLRSRLESLEAKIRSEEILRANDRLEKLEANMRSDNLLQERLNKLEAQIRLDSAEPHLKTSGLDQSTVTPETTIAITATPSSESQIGRSDKKRPNESKKKSAKSETWLHEPKESAKMDLKPNSAPVYGSQSHSNEHEGSGTLEPSTSTTHVSEPRAPPNESVDKVSKKQNLNSAHDQDVVNRVDISKDSQPHVKSADNRRSTVSGRKSTSKSVASADEANKPKAQHEGRSRSKKKKKKLNDRNKK